MNGGNINIDTYDETNCAALHYASQWVHTNLVHLFVGGGAHMHRVEFGRQTALHVAWKNERDEVAVILLNKDVNIQAVTKVRWTA